MREHWEHKVVTLDTVMPEKGRKGKPSYSSQALFPQLDEEGAQGWELVSVLPGFLEEHEAITSYGDSWTHHYLCFFSASQAGGVRATPLRVM